jgi:hypothetical protein
MNPYLCWGCWKFRGRPGSDVLGREQTSGFTSQLSQLDRRVDTNYPGRRIVKHVKRIVYIRGQKRDGKCQSIVLVSRLNRDRPN